MKTTVIGAAGTIGRTVTDTLLAEGLPVRLVGRDLKRRTALNRAASDLVADFTSAFAQLRKAPAERDAAAAPKKRRPRRAA